MKTILLDTNIIIDLFSGVTAALPIVSTADRILVSPIVLAEICVGFEDSRRGRARRAVLDDFLTLPYVDVVPVTQTTSEYCTGLFRYLKKEGRKIPSNDLWIAAQTLEHAAVLVTRDGHFSDIPNLRVQNPD